MVECSFKNLVVVGSNPVPFAWLKFLKGNAARKRFDDFNIGI